MSLDCIFCKIINGEIPSYTLYEDDDFKVFLDRFPSSLGHTIIVPKKHIENIFDLDLETASKIMPLASKISSELNRVLSPDGLNLLQNNAIAAGQTIFHYHLHLIPRYENDDISIKWKSGDPTDAEFKELQTKINIL